MDQAEARAHWDIPADAHVLLAMGGSLGAARPINGALKLHLDRVLDDRQSFVIWAAGKRYYDTLQKAVPAHDRLRLVPYLDRMDLAYAAADLAVCRSGAITCSELAVTGTPSVLVPSPNVTADHQTKNALALVEAGSRRAPARSRPRRPVRRRRPAAPARRCGPRGHERRRARHRPARRRRHHCDRRPGARRFPHLPMSNTKKMGEMGTVRRVHMVGIGGIGMSSIAEVLIRRGFALSGSDLKKSDVTARLEELGAVIHEGHAAENVQDADVVVYSSAVKEPEENPETAEALRRLIPIIKRSEMLGELMRAKRGVGIAGTHGKTTTTTMTGLMAQHADLDPTIIVGGKVAVFGSNAVAGGGELIVVEADEYDRTFLRLAPILAVVTNIEADHLDIYDDLEDIKDAFVQFANSVPFFGAAILCLDDENVRSVLGRIHRPIRTYGTAARRRCAPRTSSRSRRPTQPDVYEGTERLGGVTLHAPGLHNVRNALAAIAVGLELGVEFATIAAGDRGSIRASTAASRSRARRP